ncbi:MAG TPA: alpha/beta fold hydrolase [Acidimicrobiales bacterium]|nr:alpha/beta fold hydrolase [Acidimicrobiales bacterium]
MQSIDQSGNGGERLASIDWGFHENPRIVLVHGFTQSAKSWSRLAPELAGTHNVVAVDLPGHGRSTNISPADLTETARLVGEVGGHAIYVGYSLGGRVALTLALDHPELVKALVLISASPGIADAVERAVRRGTDRALAESLDPSDGSEPELSMEQFLDAWLSRPLFRDLDEIAQDRGARMQNSPRSLARSLRATSAGDMQPLQHRLTELKMPVLCLAGERDIPYVKRALLMASEIGANALSCIVGNAGHALCFERPEEFLRVVDEFLEKHQN